LPSNEKRGTKKIFWRREKIIGAGAFLALIFTLRLARGNPSSPGPKLTAGKPRRIKPRAGLVVYQFHVAEGFYSAGSLANRENRLD
jgi:hypothetical protein